MKEHTRSSSRLVSPVRSLAHRFAYLGLVLAAFALMLLGKADAVLMERFRTQVIDAVAPILDILERPVATVTQLLDEARGLATIRDDNKQLREEKARLLQWQAAARRLETENKALRNLLGFVADGQVTFIGGRVIADTGGAFAHSLILNAGTRAGVAKGQAVVTGAGLVGRIAGVGRRSSRVLLITDINSRIPVVVEPTRVRAVMAGDNSDRPGLIHLPPGATVSPGDRVVTSGHGGAFPPGLPVGVVASVTDAGIDVRPFVRRSRVEYVRVVDFGLAGILRDPSAASGASDAQASEAQATDVYGPGQ